MKIKDFEDKAHSEALILKKSNYINSIYFLFCFFFALAALNPKSSFSLNPNIIV